MKIRKAQRQDCRNLAALSIQVWLDTYAREGINNLVTNYVLDTFNERHFLEKLTQPNYHIYAAVEGDNLLGYIAIDLSSQRENAAAGKDYGYEVDTLYIQSRQRGKGLGSALLKHAGVEFGHCYWLTTWSHNTEGLGFYRHLGFEDVGVSYFELDGQLHENRVLVYCES